MHLDLPAASARRRRFPRVRSYTTVLVETVDGNCSESLERALSLGLGGLSFTHHRSMAPGTVLELVLALNRRPLSARGSVVYSAPRAAGGCEVGVEFQELGLHERRLLEGFFNRDV